jgi:polyphosphate kinase
LYSEVRLAGLLQQHEPGNQRTSPDGLTPEQQIARLARELRAFLSAQYECWNQRLLPALAHEGIRILPISFPGSHG